MPGVARSFVIEILTKTAGAVTSLTGVTLSLGAIASRALWVGAEVETAMVGAQSAIEMAGVSAQRMGDALHEAGLVAHSFIPVVELFAKAGIVGEEALTGLAMNVKMMSDVTGESANEVADSTARIIASLGLTADEGERLNSMFFNLGDMTLSNANSLRMLTTQVGATWAEMGLGLPMLNALGAALETKGLKARMVSGAMSSLAGWFDEAKGGGKVFASVLGLSGAALEKFNESTKDEKLRMFIGGLKEMPKLKADAILTTLGVQGEKAHQAFRSLSSDSQLLAKYLGFAADGFKDTSALEKQHEDVSKTLGYQIKELWNQFDIASEKLGSHMIPIVVFAIGFVKDFAKILQQIPWDDVAAGLQRTWDYWKAAFPSMWATVKEWYGIFIDLVLTAWEWWDQTWEAMKPTVFEVMDAIQQAVGDAWDWILQTIQDLTPVANEVFDAVVEAGGIAWDWLGEAFNTISEWINDMAGTMSEFLSAASVQWAAFIDAITPYVMWFWGLFVDFVTELAAEFYWVGSVIVGIVTKVWDFLYAYTTPFFSGILDALGWAAEKFMWFFNVITGGSGSAWDALMALLNPFQLILNVAKSVWHALFGSGLFHITEGVDEAIPSLQKLGGEMGKVGTVSQDVKGKAFPGSPGAKEGGGEEKTMTFTASPTHGEPIKVVVPVQVMLDGYSLARVLYEHIVEIGQERHMNEPLHPMRGVERR